MESGKPKPANMTKWLLIIASLFLFGLIALVVRAPRVVVPLTRPPQQVAPPTITVTAPVDTPLSAPLTNQQSANPSATLATTYNKIISELVGDARIKALMSLGNQVVDSGTVADLLWLANNIESGSAKEHLFNRIPARLLAHDPEAAKTWLLALPREGESISAFSAFGKAYAQLDPDAAFAFARQLPWQEAQRNYINNLLADLASTGVDKALNWLDTAAATDTHSAALLEGSAIALSRYARTNEEFSQILQRVDWKEKVHQEPALLRLFSQWAGNDPLAAATAALQTEPSSIPRKYALDAVIDKWYKSDSLGLSSWINANLNGIERDQSWRRIAEKLAGDAPAEFGDALAAITNPAVRMRAIEESIPRIAVADSSMLALLEGDSRFSEEERLAIRQQSQHLKPH